MFASALGSLVPSAVLPAQGIDKFVGTWKMNLAQSKYSSGKPPQELTVTVTKTPNGYRQLAHGVAADGSRIHTEFTATLDGKDAPVTGSPDYDAVSVKMLDANTRHAVRKQAGKDVQIIHSVVSADGQHYTSTAKGVNAKGEPVETTGVFDKQ